MVAVVGEETVVERVEGMCRVRVVGSTVAVASSGKVRRMTEI